MTKILNIILVLSSISCFSQNTIKLTFENRATISPEQIAEMPKIVQEKAIKQIQETVMISTLKVEDVTTFYTAKADSQEKKELGTIATKIVDGKKVTYNDLSTSIESSEIKFLKNSSKNTYTEMIDGKLITKNLQKTQWKRQEKNKN